MTSRVAIPVNGSTRLFTVPFPFLDRAHVKVQVNRVAQLTPLDYVWVNDTSIQFTKAPSGALEIIRQTPADKALVVFHNGSSLTEAELNTAVLQALFLAEETRDYYDQLISGSLDKLVTAAIPGADVQGVLDAVVQDILKSEELANLQQRINDIDLNASTLGGQEMRLKTVEDTVNALANVDGSSITTFLLDEQDARIAGDQAINETISLMGAKSGDSLSFVFNLDSVKVSPTESLAVRLSGLQSSIDDANASITEEQATRVSNFESLSGRMDTISAASDSNRAAIQTEQQARADGDSANALSISTLQSTVDGHTSSIQTIQQVQDGIKAQYMVKTDVNGYVSGFGLYNSGTASQFIINADQFAVVKPGYTKQVPFVVGTFGGVTGVGINGALIVNGTINADAIKATTLSAITADMGTVTAGKISLSGNSRYLIMQGGATYPLWFGTAATADEAHALFYCKNDGSLYFKGKLRGSNLDMQSTVVATTKGTAPFVVFDTANANASGATTLNATLAKLYAPDYGSGFLNTRLAHNKMDVYFFITAGGGGTGTTSINLQVSYNGGAWTTVATNPFTTNYNASESLAVRYTLQDNGWDTVQFRVNSGPLTHAVSVQMQVFNFSPSAFTAGTTSDIGAGTSSSGGGGDPWCVVAESYLSAVSRALGVRPGDAFRTFLPTTGFHDHPVEAVGAPVWAPCVRIETDGGARLECSTTTPFNLKHAKADLEDGAWKYAPAMHGEEVLVEDAHGHTSWQRVVRVKDIGMRLVVPISFGGRSFPAGMTPELRIYSHNMAKPIPSEPI